MEPTEKTAEQQDADVLAIVNAAVVEADGGEAVDLDKLTATPDASATPADGDPDPDATQGDKAAEDAGGGTGDDAAGAGDEDKAAADAAAAAAKPPEGETAEQKAARLAAEVDAGAAGTETAEQKATREAQELEAALDPKTLPEDVNPRTKERFETLATAVRTKSTELESTQKDLDDLWGLVSATGAPVEKVAQHMDFLRLTNSRKPEDLSKAMEQAQAIVADVSARLGKPAPGADPLEGFDDLKEKVKVADLTQADAEEIATLRRQNQLREQSAQEDAQQQAVIQEREAGRDALNDLQKEIQIDPNYSHAHMAVMVDYIGSMAKRVAPKDWADTARDYWARIKTKTPDQMAVMLTPDQQAALKAGRPGSAPAGKPNGATNRNRAPAGTGAHQPERGGQPAGGGSTKEPTDVLEAINLGIEQAAAR